MNIIEYEPGMLGDHQLIADARLRGLPLDDDELAIIYAEVTPEDEDWDEHDAALNRLAEEARQWLEANGFKVVEVDR